MAVRYREALAQKEAWEQEKKAIKIQQQIHKERRKLLNPFAKISFSKWLIFFLFLNCTGLEIFTAWVTVQTIQLAFATGAIIDFSPLVTLIGLVVGEVIGFDSMGYAHVADDSGAIYVRAKHSLLTLGNVVKINCEKIGMFFLKKSLFLLTSSLFYI